MIESHAPRTELKIGEVTIGIDEAEEVLNAIRGGLVDAVVVTDGGAEHVYTFRDPSHPYRVLIEAMNQGAALVTFDGLVCYHNPHLGALLGEPGGSVTGRMLSELVVIEQIGLIDAAVNAARSAPTHLEVMLKDVSGRRVPVLLSLSAASLAEIPVCCVVVTDLTEHDRQEARYRAARLDVEARERLVSIAAHELRGPLATLVLQGDTLALEAEHGALSNEGARDAIRMLNVQTRELAGMIDKLLDLGSVTRGDLRLSREDMDLAELVREICDVQTRVYERDGVVLALELEPSPGRWDRMRISQVVTNLLSNAIKYGREAPITVKVSSDRRVARLVVEDRGPGIAPADRDRLFQPYQRLTPDAPAKGLGLGLYITAEIVKAHGGTVRIEGEPGAGARFVVELPVDPRFRSDDVGSSK